MRRSRVPKRRVATLDRPLPGGRNEGFPADSVLVASFHKTSGMKGVSADQVDTSKWIH